MQELIQFQLTKVRVIHLEYLDEGDVPFCSNTITDYANNQNQTKTISSSRITRKPETSLLFNIRSESANETIEIE